MSIEGPNKATKARNKIENSEIEQSLQNQVKHPKKKNGWQTQLTKVPK
jgi:hypothetical protein